MNAPKSSRVSHTTEFKNLQLQFMKWATRWTNVEDKTEQQPIDLPDLVQLLQALGFYIRRMDGCLPEETWPLMANERGVRVIITCNHSGHRCYLEKPLNANMCKCVNVPSDSTEYGFWEIVATKPSLNQNASVVETGSDLIPSLSEELKQLIYSVTNYLVHMIHETNASKSDLTENVCVPERHSDQYHSIRQPVRSAMAKAASSMFDFTRYPTVVVTSPHGGNHSPTRYRSLDTLTAKGADSEFPEPGSLAATYSISEHETSTTLSHPNVRLTADDAGCDSKPTADEPQASGKALSLMKSAVQHLLNAISLIEANDADVSSESVFEKQLKTGVKDTKKSMAQSSSPRSPLTTRAASSPNLSQLSSSRILKPTQTKSKSPRLLSKSTSTTNVKSASKAKKPENKTESRKTVSASSAGDVESKTAPKTDSQAQATKRKSLYAHVKSTIPKPSSFKKK